MEEEPVNEVEDAEISAPLRAPHPGMDRVVNLWFV